MFSPAQAQVTTNGYYRVQNATTKRYAGLYDTKGKLDKVATSVDAKAIRTYYDFNRVVSDPASVIYFNKTTAGYSLHAQGTSSTQILGNYYLQLKGVGTTGKLYNAYGSDSGYQIYLSDEAYYNAGSGTGTYQEKYDSMGYMLTGGTSTRNWYITPISATDNANYFGFSPKLAAGDGYYQSFYAEFPFSFYSTGMSAYYVDKRGDAEGVAQLAPITGAELPGATPMIIKCSSPSAVNNRINLLGSSTAKVSGNQLTGVYFCSSDNLLSPYDRLAGNHENYVVNDPSTMRLLAVDNGKLVLKKSAAAYIPANSFYMTVPAGSPDIYRLLSKGDANGDEKVTIPDAVSTINKILGKPSSSFVSTVADLNNDGLFKINDVAGIVNIILGVGSTAAKANDVSMAKRVMAANSYNGTDKFYVNDCDVTIGSTTDINILLENTTPYCAFQFELVLPAGVSLAKDEYGDHMITLSTTRLKNFTIGSNQLSETRYIFVVSNNTNAYIRDTKGVLLTLTLQADANLKEGTTAQATLENIVFTDPEELEYDFPNSSFSIKAVTTGIDAVSTNTEHSTDIYDLQGRKVSKMSKGIYIVNGKKVVNK
jgi:hypothetical protein